MPNEQRRALEMVCGYAETATRNYVREVGKETEHSTYGRKQIAIVREMLGDASRPVPEPPHAEESEVVKAMRVVVRRKFEEGERC